MPALTVDYRLDPETSGWTATMPDVPALVTQGRTLGEVHKRVREALSLLRDDAATVQLRGRTVWGPELGLSTQALAAVRAETDLRVQSLDLNAELEQATMHAVQVLIHDENQTFRFTGSLLGITHQRVEQIAKFEAAE